MNLKILYIGWGEDWSKDIVEPSTTLNGTSFETGTAHLEYQFYEHLATHNVIKKVFDAEKSGYDAVVIGCFYDPGLREARELVRIPVIGVCEASLHIASMITAGKFSILVGRKKWIPKMADNARNYGFEPKISSWRILDLTVPDMSDREKSKGGDFERNQGGQRRGYGRMRRIGMHRYGRTGEESPGRNRHTYIGSDTDGRQDG